MNNGHARLSPSSAERWLNCPGSMRLADAVLADFPETPNKYMQDGTDAHELAAYALRFGEDLTANVFTNGESRMFDITPEMRDAVGIYTDYVKHLQALHSSVLFVEQRVSLKNLPDMPEEVFGTADAILISDHHGVLDIVDFKYGQGVVVRAANNPQLMCYVLGALLFANPSLEKALEKYSSITMHIVQPRAEQADGPIRTWEISADDVRDFVKKLVDAAWATQHIAAPLVPGEWCRFCPARARCPALKAHTESVAMVEFVAQEPEPMPVEMLSTAEVSELLRKVPTIELWIRALRQHIEAELLAGRPVPGWKLVNKRAMRLWKDADAVERWAVERLVNAYNEPKMKSPAQLEKDVGKKNLPKDLWESKSSGLALVPETDPRPEVSALPPASDVALQLYNPEAEEE